MDPNLCFVSQVAIVGSLAYASYLVVKCPCPTPVGCSTGQFYLALSLAATIVVVTNVGITAS